ncbi:SulP family inorganic anion transporter [Achromobacter sp. F4_2707]|uniref:SulP family inorganic anion transporter n=1 Tax=Achromobacter sp. F4_2707 TaxID=3114286 RepID=UPI0039C5DC60
MAIQRYLPFLNWPRLTLKRFEREFLAGLTVGLMALPQSVAYAGLAGMPLVTGIYATLLPTLVASLFSATPRLAVGPTALTCLLVFGALSGMAEPGSTQWVVLAGWLALLSGVFQMSLGFLRQGWLMDLVSAPVLMAFTQAAALLIITSQLPALLTLGWGSEATPVWHLPSAVLGTAALVFVLVCKKLRPSLPAVFLLLLVAAGAAWLWGWDEKGVEVVGPLPGGFPSLGLPGRLSLEQLLELVFPAMVIALVSFMETAASARLDSIQSGERWNRDQDLIGQGAAKLSAALCGAFPTSTSFSRSALNLFAGAQSGWSNVFCALVLAVMLLVGLPVLAWVPKAVLAAIVVGSVLGMFQFQPWKRLWQTSRRDLLVALTTLVVTYAAAPSMYWGICAGLVLSLLIFVRRRLRPRIVELGRHPDLSLRDRHFWKLPPLSENCLAVRPDCSLDYLIAPAVERRILALCEGRGDLRSVFIFMQGVNLIDATGLEVVARLFERLRKQGLKIHIVGAKLEVEQSMKRVFTRWEEVRFHRTEQEALQAMETMPGDEKEQARESS